MTPIRLTEQVIVRRLLKQSPRQRRSCSAAALASLAVRGLALLAACLMLGSVAPGLLWLALAVAVVFCLGWP